METIDKYFHEIGNSKIVKDFFGYYPCLHDSEVIEIRLYRELEMDFSGPKLFLTLYCFDYRLKQDDPNSKQSKLKIIFENTEIDYIEKFNHQNAMADFYMEKYFCNRLNEERYRIKFGEFGALVEFTCKKFSIQSIEPYKPIDYFEQFK